MNPPKKKPTGYDRLICGAGIWQRQLLLWLLTLPLAACSATGVVVGNPAPESSLSHQSNPVTGECVVLLHGLARSFRSMNKMQSALEAAGYRTVNIGYPSTKHKIAELVADFVAPAIAQECSPEKYRLNFVGHSLGGIITRAYIAEYSPNHVGRVVMLGTPNQGSELTSVFGNLWVCQWIFGPASLQLTTDADSFPNQLPPIDYEVFAVAGTKSTNPIYSMVIPGVDDGKVSVSSAKLAGAKAFLAVPYTHTFLMQKDIVISNTLAFLRSGEVL